MKKIKILILTLIMFFSCTSARANDISVKHENGIYHVVLKGEKIKKKIKFVVSDDLKTNKEAHTTSGATLTVNAGFFDPKNGKTISYIVTDRMTAADPMFNSSLISNPFFRKNMSKILNRTEFRVMQCGNKFNYEIASHKSDVPFGCFIITSAQGGPLIFPQLQLKGL